jgi:cyclophilin family peptidyl-prolyl cis-trans isomerase/rhodanese-related sulfurtransferase
MNRSLFMIIAAALALNVPSSGQAIENVGPQQALDRLAAPRTFLVDVRSVAEYVFVGHPVKAHNVPLSFWSETEQKLIPNDHFVADLQARFQVDDTLIFMCRSGGRSLRAAQAAQGAGFKKVVNVTDGFEGKKDDQGRFTIGGWKPAGLPYTYDVDPALAYKGASAVAVMTTSLGTMVFKLFEADAPKTTAQFKKLAAAGFYDGKDFYRVVKGHVIQAGGGGAPALPPEFNKNPHVFGTLGLGRTGDENSGDSEIYVCVAPRPHLDGKYTVFGQLVEGEAVLKRIAEVPVEEIWTGPEKKMAMHKPLQTVVLEKIRIETR